MVTLFLFLSLDYQGKGYGRRALEQLTAFYEGRITNLSEEHKPKALAEGAALKGGELLFLPGRDCIFSVSANNMDEC